MSKLSRRSLLGSAAVVVAGLSPVEVLAAMPGEITKRHEQEGPQ
jgi:hypothetical protein